MVELIFTSLYITGVCTSLFLIATKDEFEEEPSGHEKLAKLIEKQFGDTARQLLANRHAET